MRFSPNEGGSRTLPKGAHVLAISRIARRLFKVAHAAGLVADARFQRLLGGGLF